VSRRTLAATVVALATLTGCSAEEAQMGALAPISAVIESFTPASGRTDPAFAQLNTLVLEAPRLAAQAAASLTTASREQTRLGAIYVLGLTARSPRELAALRRALGDRILEHRVIAAGALIGMGEKEAIPVLIEALRRTGRLPFSNVSEAAHAAEALGAYTGQDLGSDAEAWSDWFEAEGPALTWDDTERRFRS